MRKRDLCQKISRSIGIVTTEIFNLTYCTSLYRFLHATKSIFYVTWRSVSKIGKST